MTWNLADSCHGVNGYLRELFSRQDGAVHLHIAIGAHARIVDDSASFPQKFPNAWSNLIDSSNRPLASALSTSF
jgi:hypothetical protein